MLAQDLDMLAYPNVGTYFGERLQVAKPVQFHGDMMKLICWHIPAIGPALLAHILYIGKKIGI